MLKLTSVDEALIDDSYNAFLSNIKQFFENNEIKNALHCYLILKEMLRTGLLSVENNIAFDDEYNYLKISNMNNIGVQVMYGVCCCRHVSALIKDILNVLNFNASLYYIFIDEKGIWHCSTPLEANHVSVLIKDEDGEYILDPISDTTLKKDLAENFNAVDINVTDIDERYYKNYSDPNIQNIGRVLKKYYNIQEVGIKQIYDY